VRIRVALPDDGTDRRLATQLLNELGVTRVDSVAVRAVAALQQAKARRGRLPEPRAARLVTIVVDPHQADPVFDFVFRAARIDRPGGGFVMQDRLPMASGYELPAGLPSADCVDD
jgi:hypothetical protein